MAWRESSEMDERMRFIADHLSGDENVTALCGRYGISRKTGYKWINRYEAEGPPGLVNRSHAPFQHGLATAPALIERIVAEKEAHLEWGPRKILARLRQRDGSSPWPAASTIGEILKRHGLVAGRRRARWRAAASAELTKAQSPNHVWTADHKGWFRTGDGKRCEPLTVMDAFSRYDLALAATTSARGEEARPVFARVFAEHGLPQIIRSDNGPPFASVGVTGLTALSVYFIELGIALERITPGKPTQNGAHERFHRTLLPSIAKPAATAEAQQAVFEVFRRDYNEQRPHEALGQTPPAGHYRASERKLPATVPEPDYPDEAAKRRVRSCGAIKWRGDLVFVSEALIGKTVAIEETHAGDWVMRFHAHPLGLIDEKNARLRRRSAGSPRQAGAGAHQTQTPEL
jgi:putative transposase